MNRGQGFKRPELPPRVRPVVTRNVDPPRAVMRPATRFAEPVTKENAIRSEPYLRLVASLPCWRCGVQGHTQAAHGDEGKGMQIKACDLTAWPACGPRGGLVGCHYFVGSTGSISREERRTLEKQAAADTQATLIEMSQDDAKVRRVLIAVGLVKG
jgi:hypothetical protein